MDQKQIERINALAKKAKAEGLTDKEKEEQQQLRKAYIQTWRNGMRQTLESVRFVEEDGTKTPLKKKSEDNND